MIGVVVSHEGLDGIQEAGVQLLGLIKDEQGLRAALQGLAELPLQLRLEAAGTSVRSPRGALG